MIERLRGVATPNTDNVTIKQNSDNGSNFDILCSLFVLLPPANSLKVPENVTAAKKSKVSRNSYEIGYLIKDSSWLDEYNY